MGNAVILHGKPSREKYENPNNPKPHEAHWFPWLKERLDALGRPTVIPVLPVPYDPVYKDWCASLQHYPINRGTAIIGLSAGAELATRYLSEDPLVIVEQLHLVAPWRAKPGEYGGFSDYAIDENLPNRVGKLAVWNSLDDSERIQVNVTNLREIWSGIEYRELQNYGHFMLGNNMVSVEFPELLDEILAA